MVNQKIKWTADEEAALLAGIAKHGPGKWKIILRDTDFATPLQNRSNIDLKDKWRNLSASSNGERRRSSKSSYLLPAALSSTTNEPSHTPALLTAPTAARDETTDAAKIYGRSDSRKSKTALGFNAMIFDALKASNNSKGSDIRMIVNYIEERYETPPNLKRLIGSKLRKLVARGKLNKTENLYTIRNASVARSKRLILEQKQIKTHHSSSREACRWLKSLSEASKTAAYKIAAAESKSFQADEAFNEADRASKLAEESDCFLEIAKDIFERCSRGQAVYI
uniref:MYB transcription factor n=1 Tax=Kalanchoe fedtschenkoi TaxID=63787 RepID=A0A7N0UA34_KALFE